MSGRPGRGESAGLALVAVSAVSFGTLGIFGKWAPGRGLDIPTLLGLRFGIAAVLLWAMVAVRRERVWYGRRRAAGMVMMGLLYVGQASAFFSSLRFVPAAITSILLYVYPGVVTVLARVLFGERVTRGRGMALLLASAGVILVAGPGRSSGLALQGVLLGLLSAAVYSAYILLGSAVLRGIGALPAMAVVSSVAGACFLVAASAGGGLHHVEPSAWGVIVGIVVVPTLIAATSFLAGLSRIGPARAAIVSTLEPATTALLAALLLGESLAPSRIVGGAMVLAAAVLLARVRSPGRDPSLAALRTEA